MRARRPARSRTPALLSRYTPIELFYRNQGEENSGYLTNSFLTSIAEAAGVKDIDKWNSDRQDSRWDAVLSKNSTEAQNLGFTGTPSILVQGPGGRKPFAAIPTFSQIQTAVKAVRQRPD